jgi:hypothetical protein
MGKCTDCRHLFKPEGKATEGMCEKGVVILNFQNTGFTNVGAMPGFGCSMHQYAFTTADEADAIEPIEA